ncbi:hypothetical protein Tco_1255455 [Tanacetum coccineum]
MNSTCTQRLRFGLLPSLWYFAFGWNLDDLHVTWAHLEKKRTRPRTNTKILEDLSLQMLETASEAIHDAVAAHQATTSQYFTTASALADSRANLEDSFHDGKRDCVERIPALKQGSNKCSKELIYKLQLVRNKLVKSHKPIDIWLIIQKLNMQNFKVFVALLIIPKILKKRRRSFRFTNYIVDKEDCLPTIEKEWNQEIVGHNMYRVVKKLKAISNGWLRSS